jgi:hypothetical protein
MRTKIMIGTALSLILLVLAPSISAVEHKTIAKETCTFLSLEKLTFNVRDMKIGIGVRIILYTLYCIIIEILVTYLGQMLDNGA